MSVDPRAASGFRAADLYERGRPSYPREAVLEATRAAGIAETATVLDLGAGTGKLARVLQPLVAGVVAVDPAEPMLAELRRRLPSVDARAGTAEEIPLPDASVDGVFASEAFHWFGTAAACHEIARVLRPGGGLVLLWNRERWDAAGLPALRDLRALVAPIRRAAGEFPAGDDRWQAALAATGLFTPLSRTTAEHVHRLDAGGFRALVASWSWIANLPDERRREVLDAVERLADGGELALPYRTELYWCRASVQPTVSGSGRGAGRSM
jgi:SAM-dependent methyltransferase